ncbi:lysozyme g-like [Trachemys scripta elegans]|uniref:lysozyme g-like n=1 Tax=Trachemys scripta elegans TaxID=31138 RepID=UPI001557F7BA|nr:lysozyme g-like [Trachemys scripta elegans]
MCSSYYLKSEKVDPATGREPPATPPHRSSLPLARYPEEDWTHLPRASYPEEDWTSLPHAGDPGGEPPDLPPNPAPEEPMLLDWSKPSVTNECIPPSLTSTIMSRESHTGNALKDGRGDRGNGFGLMQVDKRSHNPVGTWDSKKQIADNAIKKKFPQCPPEQQLKGSISAYNAGPKSVQSNDRMDIGITNNDYGNDVIARAQFLERKGFGN